MTIEQLKSIITEFPHNKLILTTISGRMLYPHEITIGKGGLLKLYGTGNDWNYFVVAKDVCGVEYEEERTQP